MKDLQKLSLAKAVRERIANVVKTLCRKAKKSGTQVDIIFRKSCPGATNSAYVSFRNGLKKHGLWEKVRDRLARERFDQMFAEEARRIGRAVAHPAQPYFPEFDSLPAIRIGSRGMAAGD